MMVSLYQPAALPRKLSRKDKAIDLGICCSQCIPDTIAGNSNAFAPLCTSFHRLFKPKSFALRWHGKLDRIHISLS
jgi:hypothetical protein